MKSTKELLNSYREKINNVSLSNSSSNSKFPDFNLGETLRSSRIIYHNHAPRSVDFTPQEVKQKLSQASMMQLQNISEKNQIISKIPIQGSALEKSRQNSHSNQQQNLHQHSMSMKMSSSPHIIPPVNAGVTGSQINLSGSMKQASPLLKGESRSSSSNFYKEQNNIFFKTLKQPNFLNNYSNLKNQQLSYNNPLTSTTAAFHSEKQHMNESKRAPFVNYPNLKNIRIKVKPQPEETHYLSRNSYELFHVIGRGGFGKVWKVENKKTRGIYALKEMAKSK